MDFSTTWQNLKNKLNTLWLKFDDEMQYKAFVGLLVVVSLIIVGVVIF